MEYWIVGVMIIYFSITPLLHHSNEHKRCQNDDSLEITERDIQ
jgi:hypothetical protein